MIYFIRNQDHGLIKIGTTIRLGQRLKQLAAEADGNLIVLAVTEGSHAEEKALHQRFAHLRIIGEWFEPGDDLLGFIVAEGRKWDGRNEAPDYTLVRMDDELCEKARKLAALRKISMAEMFASVLRPWVDKEWIKEVRKLKEDGGE